MDRKTNIAITFSLFVLSIFSLILFFIFSSDTSLSGVFMIMFGVFGVGTLGFFGYQIIGYSVQKDAELEATELAKKVKFPTNYLV